MRVAIFEARNRLGGRVLTIRDPFQAGQHAEAGGELIDGDHDTTRRLAAALGVTLRRSLTQGFGLAMRNARGRVRVTRSQAPAWRALQQVFRVATRDFVLAESRWDSAIATELARQSVTAWLKARGAPRRLHDIAQAMRGFFLADPDELSCLPFVEQLADGGDPSVSGLFRVEGGSDRLVDALARRSHADIHLGCTVKRIVRRAQRVTVTMMAAGRRRLEEVDAASVIVTVPAPLASGIAFDPPLPAMQRRALAALRYGPATKLSLQLASRDWRRDGRPRAFGTNLDAGAVWEATDGQPGRPGILTLLAGGSASGLLRARVSEHSLDGILHELRWLGITTTPVLAHHMKAWEQDPLARGGYAYFDTAYDPQLRAWLARPLGPVLFAGEHTSLRWQGYMNGAIESGLRAAAEAATIA